MDEPKVDYTAIEVANMGGYGRTPLFKDNDANYDNIPQMLNDSMDKAKHVFVLVYMGEMLKTCGIFNFVTPRIRLTPTAVYRKLLARYKDGIFFYTDYPSSSFQYLDVVEV